jgi:hypothetical protein
VVELPRREHVSNVDLRGELPRYEQSTAEKIYPAYLNHRDRRLHQQPPCMLMCPHDTIYHTHKAGSLVLRPTCRRSAHATSRMPRTPPVALPLSSPPCHHRRHQEQCLRQHIGKNTNQQCMCHHLHRRHSRYDSGGKRRHLKETRITTRRS